MVVSYVAGSGFVPLFSGVGPWSGRLEPIGGLQLRAARENSGSVYVSLSGGNFFSGQIGTLVGSGGPTINSGGWTPLSGNISSGLMDGMQIGPGDAYFVPRIAIPNTGASSGNWSICLGCDTLCSGGFARVYVEAL